MKISKLLLNKRNAVFSFFKIKIHILSYLIVIAFLLVITKAYAMQKATESKISLSSGKNMALSVFTFSSGGNYRTLKTAFESDNIANPLINFNVADNVAIDGRVNATGTTAGLTFTKTNTGSNISTFKLVNAENKQLDTPILLV